MSQNYFQSVTQPPAGGRPNFPDNFMDGNNNNLGASQAFQPGMGGGLNNYQQPFAANNNASMNNSILGASQGYQQPFANNNATLNSSMLGASQGYQQPFAVSGNNAMMPGMGALGQNNYNAQPGYQGFQAAFPGMGGQQNNQTYGAQGTFPGMNQQPAQSFMGGQQNFSSMGAQSNFPAMNAPLPPQAMYPGMNTGASNLLPGQQFPGMQNQLTVSAMKFLEQVQGFLILHKLELEPMLVKDLMVPLGSRHISRETLDLLGRHCRVEPLLDQVTLNELETRLKDDTPGVNFPNTLSLQTLRQLLNSTGITATDSAPKAQNAAKIPLQYTTIKQYMATHKLTKAEELFAKELIILEGQTEFPVKLVDKEIFMKRMMELGLILELINSILADISNVDGRISLQKLDEKLSGSNTLANFPQIKKMEPAKAKEIITQSFDQIKRYITMNEVNLVDTLLQQEKDDGYLNRNEFSNALDKMGFQISGSEHEDRIEAFFLEFDQQKSNKLDIEEIMIRFYGHANLKKANPNQRFASVYNEIRKYMESKKLLSLATIFFDNNYNARHALQIMECVQKKINYKYEKEIFCDQMAVEIGIAGFKSIQADFLKEFSVDDKYIDYQKFADYIGYTKPPKSNIEENKRQFYKTFLKELSSLQTLETELARSDYNVSGFLNISVFINVISGFSNTLANDIQLIKNIAQDFSFQGDMVNYRAFVQQVSIEIGKAGALHKVFRLFYEYLQFKKNESNYSQPDLYGTIFSLVDAAKDKRFNQQNLMDLLEDRLGMQKDLAKVEVQQFFQQYNPKSEYIKYADIEKDYLQFVEEENRSGKLPKITKLSMILRMIHNYAEVNAQNLRQIFGKVKLGESDMIHQYQFSKVMNLIVSAAYKSKLFDKPELEDASMSIFMNEVSTRAGGNQDFGSTMSKTMKVDNSKQVSFVVLQNLYNTTFNIQENDSAQLVPVQIDNLIAHIAKVTLDNLRNNFDLKQHLIYPRCSMRDFVDKLMAEPLSCGKTHRHDILQELGKRYNQGEGVVNTQMLCIDIESKVERQKEKNSVFSELRRQVTIKNTNINAAFNQALPEIQKFKIEYLTPKEFYNVFLYLECKSASEMKMRDMLSSILQHDDQGKYSYLEFIKEYKMADESPAQRRKGRRLYTTRDEIVKRIAYVVEHRKLKTFGSILADQDMENKQMVAREAFYRTIDSLQFGLGEGDIQELMRGYSKGQFVDIGLFKDDLNMLIHSIEYRIELRSVLDAMLNERVVDHIEDGTPRNAILAKSSDPRLLSAFKSLAREIMCALFVKETDCNVWFPRFSSFKKGGLIVGEFKSAIEQLDALAVLPEPEKTVSAYYENMVQRQITTIGYNEQTLLLDQLNILVNQDCIAKTRLKMIEDILMTVAIHLTDKRLPLMDILQNYDSQRTGYIYKTDFTNQFLDNYLKLYLNPKTGEGLSTNQKQLLATRYAPNPSVLSFPYDQFVNDMRRKEEEAKGSIRIYMTQKDIEEDDKLENEEAEARIQEEQQLNSYQQRVMQETLPAHSKRNTYVTERTLTKQHLKGSMQIASFIFDDIMMNTYRRGLSIEMYFRAFSKIHLNELLINKEDFGRAIASLDIDWGSNVSKVTDTFDAIDIATNQGKPKGVISPSDIAHSVFLNGGHNVDDILSVHIMAIHKALKGKNLLGKLREFFNFINMKRDNTCAAKEFKSMLLERLELNKLDVIKDHHADMLVQRYKDLDSSDDTQTRVNFSGFIKDMEFSEQGISPALVWAIELATNVIKSLIVFGYNAPEQLFRKYSRMEGILIFEEFKKAIDELQLQSYHVDEEIREFFNHVQLSQAGTQATMPGLQVAQTNVTKVSTVQLVNTIKRLCPKTPGMIYQDIFQSLWADTKKNNMSINSVKAAFTSFDLEKQGFVHFDSFTIALEDKLKIGSITPLDIKVLSKRYKKVNGMEEVVEYPKFFADYEKFEQLGMRAGHDPLKGQTGPTNVQGSAPVQSKGKPLTAEQAKLYQDMSAYFKSKNLTDKLCDGLASRDGMRGVLGYQGIIDAFASVGAKPNSAQMSKILDPLPVDPLDNSYNYIIMIEHLFGRLKAQETQLKFKLAGLGGTVGAAAQNQVPQKQLAISPRFKDAIEVKLSFLQSVIHSMTKGSYLLRETEFTKVFRNVGIVVASADHELLTLAFREMRNIQTQALDFRQFIKRFQITDTTAQIINAMQKQISENNIHLTSDGNGTGVLGNKEQISLEDFQKFILSAKLDLNAYTMNQVSTAFEQMAERREKLDRATLVRILKGEKDPTQSQQEWLPFIANELVYHIVNNNLNIFKFVTPGSKRLSLEKFNTLLSQMLKYKPSNPKDMPVLFQYLGMKEQGTETITQISIDKLIEAVRRVDPSYCLQETQKAAQQQPAASQQQTGAQKVPQIQQLQQKQTPLEKAQKTLSTFTPNLKAIFTKINEQVRKNGLTNRQLFERMDINKNGIVEKPEFFSFFAKDFQVKGVAIPNDVELVFDSLDMNKDGLVSVNEFCLCLEGVQMTLEQKLKNFDPDLEKALIDEVNILFDFFDTNKDGQISFTELSSALRASSPHLTPNDIENMLKATDANKSDTIDRKEFMDFMLPQLKQEMLTYDKNFDDLRRLFKEYDSDQSNYLSKEELRAALIKLTIELSEMQLDELISEIDLDNNGVIDIDEFIAFLSIADQIKFKNPQTKATVIKIKHARRLQPIDFYNCFKNLPKFFLPSFTQEDLEKKYLHTPSFGIYPEFDSKTLQYKDLNKFDDLPKMPPRKFIEKYLPNQGCELTIEECVNIPMPKSEDFDWGKICNREVRIVLADLRTEQFLSNVHIMSAGWKAEFPSKWLFNVSECQTMGKNLLMRTDQFSKVKHEAGIDPFRDVQLLFELVLYTKQQDSQPQQVCCAWGSLPLNQMDKVAKHKITLKGGSPFSELKMSKEELYQEKKGFEFLKKLTASSEDPHLLLSLKPLSKLPEQTLMLLSMLPSSCIINRRLLSFLAAFRLFSFKKLMKAQQQMIAPQGSFAIAQFRKIYDNPDTQVVLAECWDSWETDGKQQATIDQLMVKMEEYLLKTYAIIYSEEYHFDHVYPTRSLPVDNELFVAREMAIKQQLAPIKYKKLASQQQKKPVANKENISANLAQITTDEYKPFNIAEMEVQLRGMGSSNEAKQDELAKLYQQLGLLY